MRKERQYTLDHVWTFVMYQSQVNMSTYGLDVALKYDLSRHLDGQPLQFMMKDRSVSLLEAITSHWYSTFAQKGIWRSSTCKCVLLYKYAIFTHCSGHSSGLIFSNGAVCNLCKA